jgi:hypothetical protein
MVLYGGVSPSSVIPEPEAKRSDIGNLVFIIGVIDKMDPRSGAGVPSPVEDDN